jgi:hypothetical protein
MPWSSKSTSALRTHPVELANLVQHEQDIAKVAAHKRGRRSTSRCTCSGRGKNSRKTRGLKRRRTKEVGSSSSHGATNSVISSPGIDEQSEMTETTTALNRSSSALIICHVQSRTQGAEEWPGRGDGGAQTQSAFGLGSSESSA